MPFNIEDPQVQYVVDGSGRLIANWSLMSNTDFNMTIALNPMLHVSSENITEYNPLEYVLTFEYILSHGTDEDNFIDSKFSIDMENLTVAGEHVMELETPTKDSSTGVATFKVNITNDVIGDAAVSSFIGSLNGGIYFDHYKPTPGRRYRVTMYDSAQNGWSSGSYVEVHMCGVRKVHATLVSGGSDAVDFYASFVCCH